MAKSNIISIDVRVATEADSYLPSFDNTKLTAVNTCPTWGILRYHMHKKMREESRSLALEAGSALHEVFAAVRLLELRYHQGENDQYKDHFMFHGERLFGKERFEMMCFYLDQDEDTETNQRNFALQALHSSGYEDDFNDKRRTVANMESCAIAYIKYYEFGKYPIYVENDADPTSLIGIEIAFDLVITFVVKEPRYFVAGEVIDIKDIGTVQEKTYQYRFTGKIDGLHLYDTGDVCLQDNKTTSSLQPAWSEQWALSHQMTGYAMAAGVFAKKKCFKGFVRALQVPLKSGGWGESVARDPFKRTDEQFEKWFDWFFHTAQIFDQYKDNVIDAPIYTHSCYRYFKTCSFLPFCDSAREDKQEIINEMVDDEWSPLHNTNETD